MCTLLYTRQLGKATDSGGTNTMPGYCYDPRPPLFAAGKDDDQPRLPEPSPPPWLNCTLPPADFYRPIYPRGVGRSSAFALLAGVLSIVPEEGEP